MDLQSAFEWIQKAKGRVDFSGPGVIVTAFASEPDMSVNARGQTLALASMACKEKVTQNEQVAAIARSKYTRIVQKLSARYVDAHELAKVEQHISQRENSVAEEEIKVQALQDEMKQLSVDVDKANELKSGLQEEVTIYQRQVDELQESDAERARGLAERSLNDAKERLDSAAKVSSDLGSRLAEKQQKHSLSAKYLEDERAALVEVNERKANLLAVARASAKAHADSVKFETFLKLMGVWHED